jgi:hypothetical protein
MQLLNAGQRLPSTNTWSNCTLSASTARFIANIVAFYLPGLTDSKKLSTKKREILYAQITKQCQWALGAVA